MTAFPVLVGRGRSLAYSDISQNPTPGRLSFGEKVIVRDEVTKLVDRATGRLPFVTDEQLAEEVQRRVASSLHSSHRVTKGTMSRVRGDLGLMLMRRPRGLAKVVQERELAASAPATTPPATKSKTTKGKTRGRCAKSWRDAHPGEDPMAHLNGKHHNLKSVCILADDLKARLDRVYRELGLDVNADAGTPASPAGTDPNHKGST